MFRFVCHRGGGALTFSDVLPVVQGKELDEEAGSINDIYAKGAFFMHSLRFIMGDSTFFPALKEFVTSPAYTFDNLVSTDEVETFFSKKYGSSQKPVFDLWLRSTDKLQIRLRRTMIRYQVKFDSLDMKLPLQINTDTGKLTIIVNKMVPWLKALPCRF